VERADRRVNFRFAICELHFARQRVFMNRLQAIHYATRAASSPRPQALPMVHPRRPPKKKTAQPHVSDRIWPNRSAGVLACEFRRRPRRRGEADSGRGTSGEPQAMTPAHIHITSPANWLGTPSFYFRRSRRGDGKAAVGSGQRRVFSVRAFLYYCSRHSRRSCRRLEKTIRQGARLEPSPRVCSTPP